MHLFIRVARHSACVAHPEDLAKHYACLSRIVGFSSFVSVFAAYPRKVEFYWFGV